MMSTEALAASAAPGSRIEAGPRGAKPRTLTFGRVGVYVFLVLAALFFLMPLWVMVVTSLKAMPEIQLRNIFQWPQQITFEPWLKAWDTACTGRDCNGLKPGFLNSVKITVVGTVISIIIAALNGYALSFWKYKGADILFGLLVFGAFVPYQVVIYPLIVGFRDDVVIRIYGDEQSAQIDVRSASRYGQHDFGHNASRIRTILHELRTKLESTVPAAETRSARNKSKSAKGAAKRQKAGGRGRAGRRSE